MSTNWNAVESCLEAVSADVAMEPTAAISMEQAAVKGVSAQHARMALPESLYKCKNPTPMAANWLTILFTVEVKVSSN